MRIWSMISQKGGSGKTTLVLHIAIAAMARDAAVGVIDLDPQRSAEQWSELRERQHGAQEPVVVHGSPTSLDGMLQAARETGTDLVLIDTPPAVDKSMIYAAAAADLVIVPTRSGILDRFALEETLDYLKRIGALSKSVVLLNAPSADKPARDATVAVAEAFDVPMLAVGLEDQVDLARTLGEGRGVTEAKARQGKAAKAIEAILKQLQALDAGPTKRKTRSPR